MSVSTVGIATTKRRLQKLEQKLCPPTDNCFTLMELCRALWDHDKKEFIELAQTTGLTVAVSRLEAEDAERERARQRSAGRFSRAGRCAAPDSTSRTCKPIIQPRRAEYAIMEREQEGSVKIRLSSTAFVGAILLLSQVLMSQSSTDPWSAADLLESTALAKTLQSSKAKPPVILAVAFPVLYNNKHLPQAIFAGPGSTAAGIEALKKAAAALGKDSDIVIYCGCCPMEKCPNIRPAYSTLKQMGFTKVRVLHVPTNMATDWFDKGYPSEEGSALK